MNVLVYIILVAILIVAGPLLMIWALNTLFGLGIAYNIWTWLAALILGFFVFGRNS